jgi:hypothetical protein
MDNGSATLDGTDLAEVKPLTVPTGHFARNELGPGLTNVIRPPSFDPLL